MDSPYVKQVLICKDDMECLENPRGWMSGNLINCFCSEIVKSSGRSKKITCFPTEFWSLMHLPINAASRCDKYIWDSDLLIFPICHVESSHWVLIVVENPKYFDMGLSKILYFDSLYQVERQNDCAKKVTKFLR
jgi:Ulp1 family protease